MAYNNNSCILADNKIYISYTNKKLMFVFIFHIFHQLSLILWKLMLRASLTISCPWTGVQLS